MRKVPKGIRALHPAVEKQATLLQLTELGIVADWLDVAATHAKRHSDTVRAMRHLRDRALILLGFWRGFRADELTRLRIEHVDLHPAKA